MNVKICIWMNIPSHHQAAFFKALSSRKDVDLQVRYYEKVPDIRKKLGWKDDNNLQLNQKYIDSVDIIEISLPDWEERIHIVPGFSAPFLKKLIDLIISKNVRWIHWSERGGVSLAKLLQFNYGLINLVYPIFLYLKGYKKYAKQINQHALGAFAIGTMAKQDFLHWGVNNKKIEFLPYSLDALNQPKEISSKLKKTNEKIFMYIGALNKRKGINLLLNAFHKLLDEACQWKLVLVGDDRSDGEYVKQAEVLGIAERIEFAGVVESSKINEYLIQADVFILPTRFDGWGAVLNEAASLGKPMISTDQAGSAYHLIKDGENGFMVKAGDTNTLSKAMQFYIDCPEQIAIHGKKSLEIFQNFTPEKSAELFISNINKFLEQKS